MLAAESGVSSLYYINPAPVLLVQRSSEVSFYFYFLFYFIFFFFFEMEFNFGYMLKAIAVGAYKWWVCYATQG